MRPQSTPPSLVTYDLSYTDTPSWLPPLLGRGLAAMGKWTSGWYRQAKDSVWTTFSEPEEPFFVKAQKNVHFVRFQAWRKGLKWQLRQIRNAILFGEINGIELGERLLATQAPDQIVEHIYSPVMYSSLLTQLERDLRKRAGVRNEAAAGEREQILAADVIQKVLQQLRSNLSNDPKLAEEYLCSDLFNAIILYSGDHISKDGLITLLNYYQDLIDDTLRARLIPLIEALPENAIDPNHLLDFAKVNRQIKSLPQNIQAVFDEYYDNLIDKDDDNHGVTAEALSDGRPTSYIKRFNDLLETAFGAAKDFAKQGIYFVRENPKAIVTATTTAAAIGAAYYLSRGEGTHTPFPFDDIAMPSPWGHFAPTMSQTSQILFDVTVVYGISVASGHPQLAAPGALITSLAHLWDGAWAAAPTVANPIPDQFAYVGVPFNLTFRWDDVFYDADNDTLSITARLSDGSPLPAWLQLEIDPFRLGFYDIPGLALGVTVAGSTAFVAGHVGGGLQIIDVANLSTPTRLGFYNTLREAMDVTVVGNTAFVADYTGGLQIIDVTNLSAPTWLGFYDTPGNAYGVAVAGSTAFVADYTGGLQIIDVANLSAPTWLGFYDTPGDVRGVAVVGSTAFVADHSIGGLQIIDVTNFSAPIRLGFYDTPGDAWGLTVAGSTAFVADRHSGLQIIDVANLSAPARLGFYNTPGQARGVAVTGSTAFVADYDVGGLQIIDVTNLSVPMSLGFYDTPGVASGVAVAGSTAFVADYTGGLQIIDVGRWVFNGTAPAPGIYTINVTASDGHGGQVTDQFRINVDMISSGIEISRTATMGSQTDPPRTSADTRSRTATAVGSHTDSHTSINTRTQTGTTPQTLASFITTRASRIATHATYPASTNTNTHTHVNTGTRTTPQTLASLIPTDSTSQNSRVLWIGLGAGIAGVLCLGTTGIIFLCLLKRRRHSTKLVTAREDSIILEGRSSHNFELAPTVRRAHKEIGGAYYQLSTLTEDEAQAIYTQTAHLIIFPEGTKKYRYVLGRGNFGAIKIAQRIEDDQYVASKKVKGEENIRLSEQEANMQRDAAGENILPIYNTIRLEGALYHFMPLAGLGNGTLIQAQLSALNNPKLAVEILKFIAKDLLTGLKTLHRRGIYHLDIKPDNVVFTKDGTAYITDFGCAKKARGAQIPHDSIGDNRYFSPERLQSCRKGETFDGEKVDIWAAGMMLLQMIKDLRPLELFELPEDFDHRIHTCTLEYLAEKLRLYKELQTPDEWDIWAVIKGLLDPNAKTRFSAEEALRAPCFKGLNDTTKQHVFEELLAGRLVRVAGISREDLDPKNYAQVAQATRSAEEDRHMRPYDSSSQQEHYGFTPTAGAAVASIKGYQKTPDHEHAAKYQRTPDHVASSSASGSGSAPAFFAPARQTAQTMEYEQQGESGYQKTPSSIH